MSNIKKKIKDAEIVFINSPNQQERADLRKQANSISMMYECFMVLLCLAILTISVLYCKYVSSHNASELSILFVLIGILIMAGVGYFILELIRQSRYPIDEQEIRKIFERCNMKSKYLNFCSLHHDVDAVLNEQGILSLKGYTKAGVKDEVKIDMMPTKCRGSKDVVVVTYDTRTGELKYPVR